MRDMHAALVLGHPAGDALLVVAVANRLLFVAIAHRADLGLPMSQRLGEFIENTLNTHNKGARPDQGRDGDLRIFGFVHWFSKDQIRAMSIGRP
jgi:hypothetical protein